MAAIKLAINKLAKQFNSDWIVSNMIIQGDTLQLIDFDSDEDDGVGVCSDKKLELTLRSIDINEPERFARVYWDVLIRILR